MAFIIGVWLALGVAALAAGVGLDRERAFYSTVLIVVASYYDLFAVMGGVPSALGPETVVFAVFLAGILDDHDRNAVDHKNCVVGHGIYLHGIPFPVRFLFARRVPGVINAAGENSVWSEIGASCARAGGDPKVCSGTSERNEVAAIALLHLAFEGAHPNVPESAVGRNAVD